MKIIGIHNGKKILLEASIALIENKYWIHIKNGPTGYEHVALDERRVKGINMGGSWIAYANERSQEKLIIPNAEMRKVLKELESIQKSNT